MVISYHAPLLTDSDDLAGTRVRLLIGSMISDHKFNCQCLSVYQTGNSTATTVTDNRFQLQLSDHWPANELLVLKSELNRVSDFSMMISFLSYTAS